MLSYFPAPYPDELWLSVLWRMLIRMGDQDPETTFAVQKEETEKCGSKVKDIRRAG